MYFLNFLIISALFLTVVAPEAVADSPPPGTKVQEIFAKLGDAERDYYDKSFSYALSTLEDGLVYDWRTAKSEGQIRAGKEFNSKSGVKCRTFSELFMIHGLEGQNTGYGCKRDGRDGWCKLKEGDMLSCAFEAPDSIIDNIVDGANNAEGKARGYKKQAESSFWDWLPF